MTLHRFHLAPECWASERPELSPADAHHCADVLRLGPGDRIEVFDGRGNVAGAELLDAHRKHCTLKIGSPKATPGPCCRITLAQAVPKGKNMDLILQKAAELGASVIVPLLSARTVVKVADSTEGEHKRERWQQIVLEACKQCGRNTVPQVEAPCTVEAFLQRRSPDDLLLLASLQPDARPLKEILAAHVSSRGGPPAVVTVLVGPEGDFTPEEIAQAKEAGALPLTLGPMILRTETAALYCLSVLGHELFGVA